MLNLSRNFYLSGPLQLVTAHTSLVSLPLSAVLLNFCYCCFSVSLALLLSSPRLIFLNKKLEIWRTVSAAASSVQFMTWVSWVRTLGCMFSSKFSLIKSDPLDSDVAAIFWLFVVNLALAHVSLHLISENYNRKKNLWLLRTLHLILGNVFSGDLCDGLGGERWGYRTPVI